MEMAYQVLQGHLGVTCHLVHSGEAMAQGGQAEPPAQICIDDDSPSSLTARWRHPTQLPHPWGGQGCEGACGPSSLTWPGCSPEPVTPPPSASKKWPGGILPWVLVRALESRACHTRQTKVLGVLGAC